MPPYGILYYQRFHQNTMAELRVSEIWRTQPPLMVSSSNTSIHLCIGADPLSYSTVLQLSSEGGSLLYGKLDLASVGTYKGLILWRFSSVFSQQKWLIAVYLLFELTTFELRMRFFFCLWTCDDTGLFGTFTYRKYLNLYLVVMFLDPMMWL